jgi:hypothetical protein
MMENQSEKQTGEIDLFELFQRVGKSISNLFNKIVQLMKLLLILIIRKSLWIIGFTMIGVGIGIALFSVTKRFYSSEMIARSNSVDNSIVINSINQLNELCRSGNYKILAENLGTTEINASHVKSIKACYGVDINKDKKVDLVDYENTYNPNDTMQSRVEEIFYLKVEVFNETVFPIINEGTKNYIKKSPYIAQNNEVRKQQTLDLINDYNLEIKKLDSLQKSYYYKQLTQAAQNSQMLFLNEKDVKLFHKDIIELINKKQLLEKSLAVDPEPITVIQDFTALSKVENPWTKYVNKTVPFFAILGLIVSLIWEQRKKIWTIIKNDNSKVG